MEIKERFVQLLSELNQGVYEKETELSLSLLAALAGESVLLLGPPGVAKSMLARRLKQAFQGAEAFEYLMSRFSTPDEIFGPVSISLLKSSDIYERNVKGFLPSADVVFLDEIWKAGPAIQNALLTVINEKVFRNGDHEVSVPLKLLIGASNELPTQGEGLEALWDRFLIRLVSTCIRDEQLFRKMLLDESQARQKEIKVSQPISTEEYHSWQEQIWQIGCTSEVLECISLIREGLHHIPVPETNLDHDVYVSDRRWKKIMHLLKTSAFIHGRKQVEVVDLYPLWHCLWSEPVEQEEIRRLVIHSLFARYLRKMEQLRKEVNEDLKVTSVRICMELARRNNDHRDDGLAVYNRFYYHVMNHGVGNTYIFLVDFHNLREYRRQDTPTQAVLYKDPLNSKRTLIRVYNGQDTSGIQIEDKVNIYRINKNLYINGVPYPIEEKLQVNQTFSDLPLPVERDYEKETEEFVTGLARFTFTLKDNLFLNETDKQDIESVSSQLRKKTALLRVDIEKLHFHANS